MKTKIAVVACSLLTLAFGSPSLPERWICVNARPVSGLYSLEVMGTASNRGQTWRSLDIFLVRNRKQDFDAIETYGYPPAYTEVSGNSRRVIIEGTNRKVFGKVTSSLSIDLTRRVRGRFASRILELGNARASAAAVYEGSLMLDVGSRVDANYIPMNCMAMAIGK